MTPHDMAAVRTRTIARAAHTCLLSAACETGNVRDARRPDIITEVGTRIQWEESEGEPFVLDGACRAEEWTIRLCATGAWTRRWPIVSFEADAGRAQPLSVAITPDETDFDIASAVELEVGPATALRQIFGDDGRSSQLDCQDYALAFTTPATGEISGQWFVAGFVEGSAGADVETLTVQPGGGLPVNAKTPRWLRALAVGLLSASSPSIAACHAECNAMDAEGTGDCDFGLGYARRDGLADCACVPVIGCGCEGEDCDELFVSYAECADTLRLE